ncbi:hypothetical protein Q1695_007630 [Nippostrongylus brasiliensis]|nr:hypothetical protein Q1695_007630 [Nippostrongylus brasiliensis]
MRAPALFRRLVVAVLVIVFVADVWPDAHRELFSSISFTYDPDKGNLTHVRTGDACSRSSILSKLVLLSSFSHPDILPPYKSVRYANWIAPLYGLAFCGVPKSMSTLLYAAFCFLNYPTRFMSANKTISTEFWNKSLCDNDLNERNSYDDAMKAIGKNATILSIIRHPLDRFLSGYLYICHYDDTFDENERCFGCKGNLSCFVEKIHRSLITFDKEQEPESAAERRAIYHFAPQTWFCDFEHHRNDFEIIHYKPGPDGAEKMAVQLDEVLANAKVPIAYRRTIHQEVLKGTTPHSTFMSPLRKKVAKQLCSDPTLVKRFLQMYFHDYVELGFL